MQLVLIEGLTLVVFRHGLMVLWVNPQLLHIFLTVYILYTWGAKDPNSVKMVVAFNSHISTLLTPAKTLFTVYIYF